MEFDKRDEHDNDSPVEEVRLAVPATDDPSMPALTFRVWVLGLTLCALLSVLIQLMIYRQNMPIIPSTCLVILALPVGRLMAAILPKTSIRLLPGTQWSFSLNPGPFSIKEHTLIYLLADAGDGLPYMVDIMALFKIFYKKDISLFVMITTLFTTQMIGYGFAGWFTRFLVNNPYMWWPSVMFDVTFLGVLHKIEDRVKGRLTRNQFFLIGTICSFAYYVIPNYFFPTLTMLSFVCWVWKDSVIAQQIGSGRSGLGLGSFALDWNSISWAGDPFLTPAYTALNMFVGFFALVYIITPLAYWTNTFNAKRFPLLSSDVYDAYGQPYNLTRVLDQSTFSLDQQAYNSYSKLYLSPFYAFNRGFGFAATAAALSHVIIFQGREIWLQYKEASGDKNTDDIHSRLMKSYKPIPKWWYHMIFISMLALAIVINITHGKDTQLPIWALLLAIGSSLIVTFPIGVIQAVSGQYILPDGIQDLAFGYLYPGRPLASLLYRAYGPNSSAKASYFISSFKLGHYMKIPPRSMFITQIIGALLSSVLSLSTTYWLLSAIKNICQPQLLPVGSPWTCPGSNQEFSNSIMSGVIGPARMYAPHGVYSSMYWFILIGFLSPFLMWVLIKYNPQKKWIKNISFPVIFSAVRGMPAVGAGNYWCFFPVCIFFNSYIFKRHKDWWARYNYLLSVALSAGAGFMVVLMFFVVQMKDIYGVSWWGSTYNDHCPLATCPIDPSVKVNGCPSIY